MIKTVIIGDEYDEELILKLKQVLIEAGVKIIDKQWGLAGSQELFEYKVKYEGSSLMIEIETYIGITLKGNSNIVDSILFKLGIVPN